MLKSYLACNKLSYHLPNSEILFENLSFDISLGEKVALIGENGVGKSTLFKIIQGELMPSNGVILRHAKIFLVPQASNNYQGSIAEVLGVKAILISLEKLATGQYENEDLEVIGDDWDMADNLQKLMLDWGLQYLSLENDFHLLSGGEKEKLLIIKALLSKADILLLDEPTNNLDLESKNLLLTKLLEIPQGVMIVTHDRMLLNEMTAILELTAQGITRFGGNYVFYKQEKERLRQIVGEKITNLDKEVNRVAQMQVVLEQKRAKQNRYGEKEVANNRYSKAVAGALKAKAEKTVSSKKKAMNEKMEQNKAEIYELELSLKDEAIKIPLPDKPFIRERLLEIKQLSFAYYDKLLLRNFDLLMRGNDRIAICGRNGCGKTTLLKLILGEIKSQSGEIKLNGRAVYINQSLDLLNPHKSMLDNILELNEGVSINEAHKTLANFKFRNVMAHKLVKVLSGGELLRACLATIFCRAKQPDIIILDEPTNNLDIKSIEILESALAQYQGALMVVSHDEDFLKNIGIVKKIMI